ncbi:MAG: hypothetical protein IKW70_09080 [Verrucomicrobia bacterium]|nr:hypothetical protein [Verrucomicrobiota bacterium]
MNDQSDQKNQNGNRPSLDELLKEARQDGILEGRLEERMTGIRLLTMAYRQLGMTDAQIIERISTEYHISTSETTLYVYSV